MMKKTNGKVKNGFIRDNPHTITQLILGREALAVLILTPVPSSLTLLEDIRGRYTELLNSDSIKETLRCTAVHCSYIRHDSLLLPHREAHLLSNILNMYGNISSPLHKQDVLISLLTAMVE